MVEKRNTLKEIILSEPGTMPVSGDTDEMTRSLGYEFELGNYCARFKHFGLDSERVHIKDMETMIKYYGAKSPYAEENKDYIKPFIENNNTGLVSAEMTDTSKLLGSGYRLGGFFISSDMKDKILTEFQSRGYSIIKN